MKGQGVSDIIIRAAAPGDLATLQEIARRTIDACYRGFLGDEDVDWYLDSGESDRELERHLADLHVMTPRARCTSSAPGVVEPQAMRMQVVAAPTATVKSRCAMLLSNGTSR